MTQQWGHPGQPGPQGRSGFQQPQGYPPQQGHWQPPVGRPSQPPKKNALLVVAIVVGALILVVGGLDIYSAPTRNTDKSQAGTPQPKGDQATGRKLPADVIAATDNGDLDWIGQNTCQTDHDKVTATAEQMSEFVQERGVPFNTPSDPTVSDTSSSFAPSASEGDLSHYSWSIGSGLLTFDSGRWCLRTLEMVGDPDQPYLPTAPTPSS